jgi:hypothetical protein
VIVGGHPWVALWDARSPLVARLRDELPARPAGSLAVLVTLTWSSGFSNELKRLLTASPPDWNWWIRLHPLMERDRASVKAWCDRDLPGRVWIDAPTDLPLPALLEAADVHLTHNSTVIQEAARFGMPSVVIDRRALDVYTEELSSGWAVFSDETPAILSSIVAQHRRRALLQPLPPYPSWKEMAAALDDLVAESGTRCLDTVSAASSPTSARA